MLDNTLLDFSHEILTQEQEHDLYLRHVNGDSKATEELVLKNLRFIRSIVQTIVEDHELHDAIMIGIEGFIYSLSKFEIEKGYRLNTYSAFWIRQHVKRFYMQYKETVVIPNHIGSLKFRVLKAKAILFNTNREVTDENVLEILAKHYPKNNYTLKDLKKFNKVPIDRTSAEFNYHNTEDNINGDTVRHAWDIVEGPSDIEIFGLNVDNIIECLTNREKFVICCRILTADKAMTLEVVGDLMGVTRERVRQIEAKALKKMKSRVNTLNLELEDFI